VVAPLVGSHGDAGAGFVSPAFGVAVAAGAGEHDTGKVVVAVPLLGAAAGCHAASAWTWVMVEIAVLCAALWWPVCAGDGVVGGLGCARARVVFATLPP
jgi:hypothetical protein